MKITKKVTSILSSFLATFDTFLLTGSISYFPVVYFLLLSEQIFKAYNQPCVFAEQHHLLTSRHKLLLIRRQRAVVSTQEGNARSA